MDTDNASLLSNACALLERSRAELQAADIEIATLQARREMLAEVVSALSGKPRTRRGRPAKQEQQQPQDDAAAIDAFAEVAA